MADSALYFYMRAFAREMLNPPPPVPNLAPIDAPCSHCGSGPGIRCKTPTGRKVRTHKVRERDARVKMALDSGRCLNRLCAAGKVWTRTGEITCPGCEGTGRSK